MSAQSQQRNSLAMESIQFLNSQEDSETRTSNQQPTDQHRRHPDFLNQIEVKIAAVLQESGIEVEAIKSEYRRAVTEGREACEDALSWRSTEHSNRFQGAVGRFLSSLAMRKGMKRAEIFDMTFRAAERSLGRLVTSVYMNSSRADHL